jgi:DNA-binding beta-propeller fold protein YncE
MGTIFSSLLPSLSLTCYFYLILSSSPVLVAAAPPLLTSDTPFVNLFVGSFPETKNGIGTSANYYRPYGIDIFPNHQYALVVDQGSHLIRKLTLSTQSVESFVGRISGYIDGVGSNALFYQPSGVEIEPSGVYALVADRANLCVRRIELSTATVTTLVGDYSTSGSLNGIGTNAQFSKFYGVTISSTALFALVADTANHLIRHVVLSTFLVTTLAGRPLSSGSLNGLETNAQFSSPFGVTISPDNDYALVADHDNQLIRRIIITTGEVSTFVGGLTSGSSNGVGTNALFKSPSSVKISRSGNFAFVADRLYNTIRRIEMSTASVTTLAGRLSLGDLNGVGTNALFSSPLSFVLLPTTHLFWSVIPTRQNAQYILEWIQKEYQSGGYQQQQQEEEEEEENGTEITLDQLVLAEVQLVGK